MFSSILFPDDDKIPQKEAKSEPGYFKDLNLEQIIRPILTGCKTYQLDGWFLTSLADADMIRYRQDVMRDLKDDGLREIISTFSKTVFELNAFVNQTREILVSNDAYHNNYLARGRMSDFASRYCSVIMETADGLNGKPILSKGLQSFTDYLHQYRVGEKFLALKTSVDALKKELSTVHYCMLMKDGTIRVRKYENQPDISVDVRKLFARFQQGNVQDYRHKLTEEPRAEHVEAAVLRLVAACYPDVFSDLNDFCTRNLEFIDPVIAQFSREVQFYLSWLDFIAPLKEKGLPFCYPRFSSSTDRLYGLNFFDLALAKSLSPEAEPVTNDFTLEPPERILVVTGPNQGGKTTYARAFGQIHYLASLGLCVPGKEASLLLFDQIYTHFEREEDLSLHSGKLQDDLKRLHDILSRATSRSLIIVNEIFSSTTLSDAILLGSHMMHAMMKIGCPAICVTFIDELATYGKETVSMMSTVDENDPTIRTFRIVRKPPDGLAYALHIASKYHLTYEQLCARLKQKM